MMFKVIVDDTVVASLLMVATSCSSMNTMSRHNPWPRYPNGSRHVYQFRMSEPKLGPLHGINGATVPVLQLEAMNHEPAAVRVIQKRTMQILEAKYEQTDIDAMVQHLDQAIILPVLKKHD